MQLFPFGHATHPQWEMAAALTLAQLRAQMALPQYASHPGLALLYITDHYADAAPDILAYLASELPLVTDWAGTVGIGICANNVEYLDEPAMALMLLDLPADQYRVFSGVSPLGLAFEAHAALVHADGDTPDIAGLVHELAHRTDAGFLFGGLSSGRADTLQFAVAADGTIRGQGNTSGVFHGGLSGVAFSAGVNMVSRVTQGCVPVAPARRVTAADRNLILRLDDQPALEVLLSDLGISLDQPQQALEMVRATLVGLAPPTGTLVQQTGNFGNDVLVRHIVGLDPARSGVAVADVVEVGMHAAFCRRNLQAARADLVRICAEIREELESEVASAPHAAERGTSVTELGAQPARRMLGALYVSCTGRGGQHFGAPSAELQLLRRSLGDVPLVGFFAAGEIAHDRLYGYTGVLTVFTD